MCWFTDLLAEELFACALSCGTCWVGGCGLNGVVDAVVSGCYKKLGDTLVTLCKSGIAGCCYCCCCVKGAKSLDWN